MRVKSISKLLILSILFSSCNISSFASTFSEDGRYETFEGDKITITDILEQDKADVEIEGNTMVNLFNTEILPINFSRDVYDEELIDLSQISTKKIIKPQTKYTMYMRYKISRHRNNNSDTNTGGYAKIGPKITYSDGSVEHVYMEQAISSGGYYAQTLTFTPRSDVKKIDLSLMMNTVYLQMSIEEVVLLEGDYSNSNIKYFEGLKSVGELEDKLEVISNSMNKKADYNESLVCHINAGLSQINNNNNSLSDLSGNGNNITLYNVRDEDIGNNYIQFNGINSYATVPRIIEDDFTIEIKVNVEDASDGHMNNIHWYNAPGIIDAEAPSVVNDFGVTVNNYGNILFGVGNLDETYVDKKSRLKEDITIVISRNREKGLMDLYINGEYLQTIRNGNKNSLNASSVLTIAKSNLLGKYCKMKFYELKIYNKYFELENFFIADKKVFNINEPLRKISNEIKDRIIKRNGQWVVERNCGKIVLDGSENWSIASPMVNAVKTIRFNTDYLYPHFLTQNSNITNYLSDYDAIKPHDGYNTDIKGVFMNHDTDRIGIRINRGELESQDSNGLKKWLAENPITLVYQLKTPIYESLNLDSCVNLYSDITYISLDSTIPTNIKMTVDRALNKAVEAIEVAKLNPTRHNISQARMWINLAKESIKKDDLQDELNKIVDINDLTIDKKKVTSNIDIYIKSDNALSMSLDTNQVVFDNYSGLEEIEELKAINIMISSSLPYDLNAYMPVPISNANGSNIMDMDTFNIKESSESTYKTFANTSTKLPLKVDCQAGNNKSHGIDLKLDTDSMYKADVYKTTIKFEAQQK